METSEKIETINKFLRNKYGIDTVTGKPMWKLVWSEDEYEYRKDLYTDWDETGTIFLREVEEVRYVKRFNYITDRYVLVNLQGIPLINQDQLQGMKMSYEPIWTFETPSTQKYIPPAADACEYIIDEINKKLGRGGHKKVEYKNPLDGLDSEELLKIERRRVDHIILELFGEDSGITEKYGDTVILNSSGKVN